MILSTSVLRRLRTFAAVVQCRRNYAIEKNLLSLSDREFFQDIFPDNARYYFRN